MRKIFIFFVLITLVTTIFPKTEKKKLDIRTAYVYKEATLLISETDLNCSFYIGENLRKDIFITGAELMGLGKSDYSDGDKLFINKGSKDGINEGDIFLIMAKGKSIFNPINFGKLGTYYLKKSLAEVTCIYDNKAVITLKNGCNPVNIKDIVVPYKKEDTVFKNGIDYRRCRIPESSLKGNVVYADLHMNAPREISGNSNLISIDIGKARVSKGDFVLFYKILKKKLPPIIIGTGIILNPQNTNSTVKILEVSYPVEVGAKVIVLPEIAGKKRITGKDEDIPIVKTLKKEERKPEEGEQTSELDIFFNFNSTSVDNSYKSNFEEIKTFIESKTQYIIVLRGYTCSIGGLEFNLKLSQERVESVKEYLINELGINKDFIETYYYGEKDAPYDNTLEEQRKKNRLVKIQVIGK